MPDGNAWLIARKRFTLGDARSKCDADLEPTHSQNSSRELLSRPAVGFSFAQLASRQSDWNPTSIRCNGLRHSARSAGSNLATGGTSMGNNLKSACDGILRKVATGKDRVPGVVAMITDRSANIYEGAAGERILGASQAMTTDTVFAIFSTTKAITGTSILQCVEEGKLDLDAPAKTYVPDIGKLEVLDGFDAAGKPKLRAPKRDITTRMLMLHTAGLRYDFFNANYLRLAQEHGQPSVITCSKASLTTPLLFDPGDKWEYGSNMDWCGQVVESIRGRRLGEGMTARIFTPPPMQHIAFSLPPPMPPPLASTHPP